MMSRGQKVNEKKYQGPSRSQKAYRQRETETKGLVTADQSQNPGYEMIGTS